MDIGVRGFEKLAEEGKDVYKITLENGKEVLVEAGTGLKEFTENMAKLGVDFGEKGVENVFNALENYRAGWENIASKFMGGVENVVMKNLNVAEEAVKGGIGAKVAGVEFGVNMGRGNVLEAKVEGKEDKIKLLQEELDSKKAEIKQLTDTHRQDLEKKDERIRELERSRTGQQKDQNQLLLEVVKNVSRPSSPTPSVGDEGEITRLREELEDRKSEFKEQLEEKKQEVKELKEEIKELKQEIRELKKSQQVAQVEIRAKQ